MRKETFEKLSSGHAWDIESQLRETNEQAAARHKEMHEALTTGDPENPQTDPGEDAAALPEHPAIENQPPAEEHHEG